MSVRVIDNSYPSPITLFEQSWLDREEKKDSLSSSTKQATTNPFIPPGKTDEQRSGIQVRFG